MKALVFGVWNRMITAHYSQHHSLHAQSLRFRVELTRRAALGSFSRILGVVDGLLLLHKFIMFILCMGAFTVGKKFERVCTLQVTTGYRPSALESGMF